MATDDKGPAMPESDIRPDTAPIAKVEQGDDQPARSRETMPFESLTPAQAAAYRAGPSEPPEEAGRTPPETDADLQPPVLDDGDERIEHTFGFDDADPVDQTHGFDDHLDDMPFGSLPGMPPIEVGPEQTADLGLRVEEKTPVIDGVRLDHRLSDLAPQSTIDYAQDIMDSVDMALPFGPNTTVDFADSLDVSLDRAMADAPVLENPTDIDFPRPETRPLGDMTPAEWAAHVLRACVGLAEVHDAQRTFDGRFEIDEKGVVGEALSAPPGTDGYAVDVRRMQHLIEVIADAVRAGSDHSPAAVVVSDALAELRPREDARSLARALRRALEARARKQRKRLDAEFDAIEARSRALSTQRRLRADLAARLARLDASIAAQAAAVSRDEDRTSMLHDEKRALDVLGGLVDGIDGMGTSLDEPIKAGGSGEPKARQVSPEDAVRRLLAVGGSVS